MHVNNIYILPFFLSPHKIRCGQLNHVFLLIDGIRSNIYRWRSVATEQVMSSATVVLQFLIFYLETLSHMKGCLLSMSRLGSTSHSKLLFTIYWPGPGPGVAWAAPLAPVTATQRTGHLLTRSPPLLNWNMNTWKATMMLEGFYEGGSLSQHEVVNGGVNLWVNIPGFLCTYCYSATVCPCQDGRGQVTCWHYLETVSCLGWLSWPWVTARCCCSTPPLGGLYWKYWEVGI